MPANYTHSAALLAACGWCPQTSLGDMYAAPHIVFSLLMVLANPTDDDPMPDWCKAPGSPAGLAALRSIMEALGYRTELRTATADGSFFVFDSVTEHVLVIIESDGWRHTAKQLLWADPTALSRALHLALSLRPAATGGDHA